MGEPYYITTAISYPNGKPHIGHAYEAIAADVIARFQKAMGRDVRFQTGTDEHGLKMAQKARDMGITPAQLAGELVETSVFSLPAATTTTAPLARAVLIAFCVVVSQALRPPSDRFSTRAGVGLTGRPATLPPTAQTIASAMSEV